MSEQKIDFGKSPFEFSKQDTHFLVRLHGELGFDLEKEFEKKLATHIEQIDSHIVIDMSGVTELHPTWTRPLMALATRAKAVKKQIRVVGPSTHVQAFFTGQGIAPSFPYATDLESALKGMMAPPKHRFDAQFINAFLVAGKEVVEAQVQTAVRPGTPFVRDMKDHMGGDISGVIGLTADKLNGSVVITFPENTFLTLMSKMLGEDYKELTPELHDGAAEITNMIFGKAKAALNEKGYGIKMAIPSVVTGKNHSIQNRSNGPRVVVPFESDVGSFTMEVSFGD
ncbi:MAG: STAS domain-containing protein [Proteobacteria bacterium]|nr:MAG: STAS domain-containing protein [Pseudomonadota bacterium]